MTELQSSTRYASEVIVDYTSSHGASVTDVRAITIQGALAKLKELGYFEDYIAHYPKHYLAAANEAIASTWLPVEMLVAHHTALEEMGLSDTEISRIAEELGTGLFDQLFATVVRAVRKVGAGTGVWFGFKQADRVMARIYNGGGCSVAQVGPKDALYELRGLPAVTSRASRVTNAAFLRGVLSITTKVCVVKVVPASQARSDYIRFSISWV